MNQGPFFIPPGAPPGTPLLMEEERPPEAVYYFRIYAIVMLLSLLGFFGFGLWLMLEPLMRGGGATVNPGEWVVGLFFAGIAGLFVIPHAIVLFAGRAKWAYTLAVVLIGLSMLWNTCCLPITIPLLIVWMKPETKKWYGIN
jgi:hypothetical protein